MRLQKFIAHSGVLSRRQAEAAIAEGRVKLNGQTVTEMGIVIDPTQDSVELDGRPLTVIQKKETFIFYKPLHVVTTRHDPQGRKTVMDYFPNRTDLYPVGRLDYETTGLLLITNDGDLAHQLTHPSFEIKKTYQARVHGHPSAATLQKLKRGIELEDGAGRFLDVRLRATHPSRRSQHVPQKLGEKETGTELEIVVGEGRNRFVRRMLEAVGHFVIKLHRTQIGDLKLTGLRPGEFRLLPESEITRQFRDVSARTTRSPK